MLRSRFMAVLCMGGICPPNRLIYSSPLVQSSFNLTGLNSGDAGEKGQVKQYLLNKLKPLRHVTDWRDCTSMMFDL